MITNPQMDIKNFVRSHTQTHINTQQVYLCLDSYSPGPELKKLDHYEVPMTECVEPQLRSRYIT